MSDPNATRTAPAPAPNVRARTTDTFGDRWVRVRETKPSVATTEFWAMVIGIAALIIIYNVSDSPSLDLWRTCLLCTLAGSAYVVSRGLAKSGTMNRNVDHDDRH